MNPALIEAQRLLESVSKAVDAGHLLSDDEVEVLKKTRSVLDEIRLSDIYRERERGRPIQEVRIKWSISPGRVTQLVALYTARIRAVIQKPDSQT